MNVSTVRIWQAPFDQTAFGFNSDADYTCVWAEPNDGASLEDIWTRFQRVDPHHGPWTPDSYTARSVSIGDVIEIDGCFWTPLPIGWRELTPDEAAIFEAVA